METHLVKTVKALRGKAIKQYGRGLPDRLVVVPLVPPFFVETKRPKGGRFEHHQKLMARKLTIAGAVVLNARTKAQVDAIMAPAGLLEIVRHYERSKDV